MRLPRPALAIAAALLIGACGGTSSTSPGNTGGNNGGNNNPPPPPVQTNAVSIGDDFFSPADIQVPVGTTVTWTWGDGVGLHNVTFPSDGILSGNKSGGATFTRTFGAAGTFNYVCTLHTNMVGSVLVK